MLALAKFLVLVQKGLCCYYTKVFKIINQENHNRESTIAIPYWAETNQSTEKCGGPDLNFMRRISINVYSYGYMYP